MSKTQTEIARACAAAMWAEDQASQALGMEIEHVDRGEARLTMRVTAQMTNGHGTCHGGYIFTLADSAFAFACNSYNQRSVAQHCSVSFIAPGRKDDLLTATALERMRAERSGIYDVSVVNQDGVLIAEFCGHSRTIKGQHLPELQDDTGA